MFDSYFVGTSAAFNLNCLSCGIGERFICRGRSCFENYQVTSSKTTTIVLTMPDYRAPGTGSKNGSRQTPMHNCEESSPPTGSQVTFVEYIAEQSIDRYRSTTTANLPCIQSNRPVSKVKHSTHRLAHRSYHHHTHRVTRRTAAAITTIQISICQETEI